jgi:hypothetical protein
MKKGGKRASRPPIARPSKKPASPPLVSRRFAVGAIGSGAFAAALMGACTGGSDPPQTAPQAPQVGPQPPQIGPQPCPVGDPSCPQPPQIDPQPPQPYFEDAGDAEAGDAAKDG